MVRWSTVHWSYSFKSWPTQRIRITSNLRKKQRCFWITFHFFNIHSLAFFHASKSCKKNGRTATDCYRVNLEWAATQQDHGFQDHYGRGCPLRLLPGKPLIRRFFRITASHFDKQQQVTRFCHRFWGILKDLWRGLNLKVPRLHGKPCQCWLIARLQQMMGCHLQKISWPWAKQPSLWVAWK